MAALIGSNVKLKINGVALVGYAEENFDFQIHPVPAVDQLREALAVPSGKAEVTGTMELQNLDPILEELTYGPAHIKMIRKLKAKKRNARGRRMMKIKAMRLQEFAAALTVLTPPVVDCRTICPELGACCRKLILWAEGTPWPATEDP